MNLRQTLFYVLTAQVLCMPVLMAQASAPNAVMTISEISPKGKALVEMPNGKRLSARAGMALPEGATLMVLEKTAVKGIYAQSKCEVEYSQNTVLHVKNAAQCAGGMPVINASKYAQFGTGANGAGCCIVKTIPVLPAPGAVLPTAVATAATNGLGFNPWYIAGGLAGAVIIGTIINDDNNSNSNTPISN